MTPLAPPLVASRHRLTWMTLELRMLLLTALLIAVLGLSSPYFLTTNNILNILDQSVVVGILAVGMTLVVLTGGIDLSVGAVVGVTGVILGLVAPGWGLWPALICSLAVGALIGFVNGGLVVWGGIAPFIVTLGMLSVGRSMTYILSGARSLIDLPDSLTTLAEGTWLGLPINVVFLAALYLAAWGYLTRTKGGRSIYALGSNMEAARIAGLRVERYRVMVYVVSGALCACAAAFLAGRIRSIDPTSGTGLELDAIAAVVIGGASLFGGRGSLIGTFFGVIIMVCIRNGLNLLGIDPYWQGTAVGSIIVAAVLAERWLSGRNIRG